MARPIARWVLPVPGGPRKTTLSLGGDEVQGSEVGDGVAFESAGVVEVELLQRLSGREPGGADAALTAVGFAGGDFALQTAPPGTPHGSSTRPGPVRPAGRRSRAAWGPSSARVRKAISAVTSRLAAVVLAVAIRPPRRRGRPPTRCRSRPGADRHSGSGSAVAGPDRLRAQHLRRLAHGPDRRSSDAWPRSAHGRRRSGRRRTPAPDPGRRATNDPAPDHRRVHRVVVGVQPNVVIAGQPQRRAPAVAGATGGSASIAARSAPIRSVGAQPSARRVRVLTTASQSPSWVLKSAGEANVRPGRNERSR